MGKPYAKFMGEISAEELYEGLMEHGLFAERLPPVFDGAEFREYCQARRRFSFADRIYHYAQFTATRNNALTRTFGIPTPMAHERLCECLSSCWPEIQQFFQEKTRGHSYKKSGMHLKKRRRTASLFQMQYNHPECECAKLGLMVGKRYLVKTDIAQCFSSTCVHAAAWALAGDTATKAGWQGKEWCRRLEGQAQKATGGELQGILIGPHTSNLLSEIVLCAVDAELKKWDYVRMIDDYECYVGSEEEAEEFLACLRESLAKFGLRINRKKTAVEKLPAAKARRWIYRMREATMALNSLGDEIVSWARAEVFLYKCVEIMEEYGNDASVLLYGMKVLAQKRVTRQAARYIAKSMTSLALLYPYLTHALDQYVYSVYRPSRGSLGSYLRQIYERCLESRHYDAAAHALQIAARHGARIASFDVQELIRRNDCILLLCGLLYCRHHGLDKSLVALRKHANRLNAGEVSMERHWPFVYECLSVGSLKGEWKNLKGAGVSFLKKEYQR